MPFSLAKPIMTGFWILFGDWGYALAAALFTVLTLDTARRGQKAPAQIALVIALAVTALWALYALFSRSAGGLPGLSSGVTETARNGAWLTVCWLLLRQAGARGGDPMPRGVKPLYIALMLALACQLCFDMMLIDWVRPDAESLPLSEASWLLRAATALGGIFLLHGLYARIDRDGGNAGIGWLGCALTTLWAYEFTHYVMTWLSEGHALVLGQMRGLVISLIAPLIALGIIRRDKSRITLSRRAAYRLVTLGFGLLYALALFAMLMLARTLDDPATQIMQIGAVFALSVIVLMLLPSAPFRMWLRVEIAKHLFTHRYDYRQEWMRFADAVGGGDEGANLSRRAARAVAHAVSAPAALLLLRDEGGTLVPEADWNWPEMAAAGHVVGGEITEQLHRRGWVVDFLNPSDPLAPVLPGWMASDARSWVLVPLSHGTELIGAVLIAAPRGRERMDWEDLDMLRVVAKQLALTLSERRHQRALAESQRFDEFNRRFAFILHDIKNMVSQMSLLAANAERHAENPEFRADMVLTLKETAGRMTDLIARLARPDQQRPGEKNICDMADIARLIAGRGRAQGRATVSGDASLPARCDAILLAQALEHLVHNALDATAADGPPVRLHLSQDQGMARIDIIDRGCGMSPAFLRDGLFRPFSSTKPNGFGLGAHEARTLVTSMGGQLNVASREGEGSEFTLYLPLAAKGQTVSSPLSLPDRKTG